MLLTVFLDEENPLEKTSDGLLLKGNLSVPGGCSVLVGVKTTRDKMDVAEFRALLSELKIMAYISSVRKHDNVVELTGAITCDIMQRMKGLPLNSLKHKLNVISKWYVCMLLFQENCG